MKELSLNILDIAENSVKANATLTKIELFEDDTHLKITISDNGHGMSEEVCKQVTDPFYTTRTTRNVGMGIPLFKMSAEQTGGSFSITSKEASRFADHGTVTQAEFIKNHLDFTPLGDVVATITTLVQGHPDTDFYFCHEKGEKRVEFDTREVRQVLGDDMPLSEYDVIKWIEGFLTEQYNLLV